ncbi:unnamed protein product, partial [Symbiodinium pilosum]
MAGVCAVTALVFTLTSLSKGEVLEVALSSDEVCTTAECSLELRQLRGQQQILETDTSDRKCASHCHYIGAALQANTPDCKDCASATPKIQTSATCASHCQYEGSTVWQYDPECKGCSPALIQTMLVQMKDEKTTELTGCASHCQYEGAMVWKYDPDCKDCVAPAPATAAATGTATCAQHCQY